MNVKLLKRVRKRFAITHHPKGIVSGGRIYDYNLYILTDVTNSYVSEAAQLGRKLNSQKQYCSDIFETEKECIDFLKCEIIRRLKCEGYGNGKMRRVRESAKKVYYVK